MANLSLRFCSLWLLIELGNLFIISRPQKKTSLIENPGIKPLNLRWKSLQRLRTSQISQERINPFLTWLFVYKNFTLPFCQTSSNSFSNSIILNCIVCFLFHISNNSSLCWFRLTRLYSSCLWNKHRWATLDHLVSILRIGGISIHQIICLQMHFV